MASIVQDFPGRFDFSRFPGLAQNGHAEPVLGCPLWGEYRKWSSQLIHCSRPNVVEHGKRHITHVAVSVLHHLHVDAKRVRKLCRKERITPFEAIDKHLKRRNHGCAVSRYASPSGESFPFRHSLPPFNASLLAGSILEGILATR
jgi:hypothetical protein